MHIVPPGHDSTYIPRRKIKTKKTEEEERNAVATARRVASRRQGIRIRLLDKLAHGAVGGVHNRDDGRPIAER